MSIFDLYHLLQIVEKPVDTVTHVDEAIFQSFETMV